MVIGRLRIDDRGNQVIEPMGHSSVMFEYQKSVAALIEAARGYQEDPNRDTLAVLARAASLLG